MTSSNPGVDVLVKAHVLAEALPYIRVYDAKGKFVASVTGGMWDEVLIAIAKAEKP